MRNWERDTPKSGLPLSKFFNTSGLLYKSMQLKNKLPTMSEDEQLRLLATDGMLIKRPIVIEGDMLVEIPPKVAVSSFMGYLKGKSSLMIYEK